MTIDDNGKTKSIQDFSRQEVLKFQDEEIQKQELRRISQARSFAFERRKRLPYLLQKGLTKPGRISYEVLRKAVNSVHIARICVNVLKEKVSKTQWAIQPIDPRQKVDEARLERVKKFFKYPNGTDSFRTLLDKILEDLLVVDAVTLEKTRFDDGTLAELHYVDATTIRPVFDEHGNQDILVPIEGKDGVTQELPVSYVQVVNSNPWGGREVGDLVAAWPKKDFVNFNMHPQGSMNYFGYGMSPIESVLGVVGNILNADNFNSTYFEEGAFPPTILQMLTSMDPRELESMREYLYSELEGRFHRPAILAGSAEMKVIDLKDITQRDMQFMQYMEFMSRLLAAAYGLSGQDIGLTDDLNRATAEVQKDLSQAKGYGSILALLKEEFNNQIIWKDFGYEDIEFEWISPDSLDPEVASRIYDASLKNGTLTLNEVRKKMGEEPYGEWADAAVLLTGEGYKPIVLGQEKKQEESSTDAIGQGQEDPFKEQAKDGADDGKGTTVEENEEEEIHKSIYTVDGYETYMDDRGYGQPFIFYNILDGKGKVIKPPVAVNVNSQLEEENTTNQLYSLGLNVCPVTRLTMDQIMTEVFPSEFVAKEFANYVSMSPSYDSKKWSAKFGDSRKYPYYLVSEFIDGMNLKDPILIDDMKRVPVKYERAIKDLAELWKIEKKYKMGDRRVDQYLIRNSDKRAYGIDYQFMNSPKRWESTKNALSDTLRQIPQLYELFMKETGQKSITKALISKFLRKNSS